MTINTVKINPLFLHGGTPMHLITGFLFRRRTDTPQAGGLERRKAGRRREKGEKRERKIRKAASVELMVASLDPCFWRMSVASTHTHTQTHTYTHIDTHTHTPPHTHTHTHTHRHTRMYKEHTLYFYIYLCE